MNVESGFYIHPLLSTLYPPLPLEFFDVDSRFSQHLFRQIISIPFCIDNLLNSRIDYHLGADNARVVRTIEGGSTDPHAMVRGLDDRILLSVEAATEFMPFSGGDALAFAKAPNVQTMLQP